MFHQIPEQKMHQVRWGLTIGWSILILSLFWDPVSVILTDPNNTWSPYALSPAVFNQETCVQVQGECLAEQAYPMATRIFWGGIVPFGVIILFIFGHEAWRRICPLSFFSQIPRSLGIQRRVTVTNSRTGTKREELAKIKAKSWLGKNHLYVQLALLFIGINIRTLFVNADRLALGLFLVFTILCSIFVGYWYAGKSWCHYFCPMAPVQMVYTGGRSVLGSQAHTNKKQVISQSMCRNVNTEGIEKTACVSCNSTCFDIDAEKNYWEGLNKPGRKMIQYSYLGFVLGFYGYFYLYAGNWDYLLSGASNHDETQLSSLWQAGFYFGDFPIAIPKIIAAPLTLLVAVTVSYYLFCYLEKRYRYIRSKINKPINILTARHHIFALSTFISINVFFIFSAPGLLGLLLGPLKTQLHAEEIFEFVLMIVSSIWLYRTVYRSQNLYTKESLSASLRRQLAKLSIDFSAVLGGRSIDDLKVDEVYILGKVLPTFNKEQSLNVYKGVLKEALENGDVNSANSLRVLEQMRLELNISDEEHYSLLTELGIEKSDLLSPTQMMMREKVLNLEGYRESLELILLKSIESGMALEEILAKEKDTIFNLQRQYDITPEQHDKIITQLYDPDSAIIQTADTFLEELRELGFRLQLLNNTSHQYQTQIFDLIRVVAVENKQQIIIKRLLSIFEILKDTPDALQRAEYLGLIAGNILDRILINPNQKITWRQRLHPRIYQRLISQDNIPSDQYFTTNLKTDAMDPEENIPTGFGELETKSPEIINLDNLPTTISLSYEDNDHLGDEMMETNIQFEDETSNESDSEGEIVRYLQELLSNIDPLIRAVALYGLQEISPNLAQKQADVILQTLAPKDWLVNEVADDLTGYTSAIYEKVPTLIVEIHNQHKTIEKVFQQPIIRIGSLEVNDLIIEQNNIAPQHCLIVLEEEGVNIIDLGSSHGIKVGDKIIKNNRHDLKKKDTIYLTNLPEPYLKTNWEIRQVRLVTEEKITTIKKLLYLFENNFFHPLNPEDLIDLAKKSVLQKYEKGVTIIEQDKMSDKIFLLLKGSADIIINNNGEEKIVNTVEKGETIGEMGVLTRRKRSARVVTASSYNELLVIQADQFERLININQHLARQLILVLSNRIQEPLVTS